ncbi:major facilitator superfamily domain-containing protein 6-like [Diadema antillarum]|uniref:major facilitator superfamily domain-containing protein 6-like n=1 Tax=Diadema antillarum TaxID=105358 RepID=UPI003A856D0C
MEKSKSDRQTSCRVGINRAMLPYKMFYFFSDGASSCIAPYRSLYLKQLGLGPSRIGIVAAMKPFATFVSNAMVGFLVDRFGWRKGFMLTSLVVWIVSLLALGFIPPAAEVADPVARSQLRLILDRINSSEFVEEEMLSRQVRSAGSGNHHNHAQHHHRDFHHLMNERIWKLRCLLFQCPSNSSRYDDMFADKQITSSGIPMHNFVTQSSSSKTLEDATTPTARSTVMSTDLLSQKSDPANLDSKNVSGIVRNENDVFLLGSDTIAELSADRSWLYDQAELLRLFIIIILITNAIYISLGSFMRLADTATLNALAKDPASDMSDYGWHRSFGGLGWAICSLTVGVLLSGSSTTVVRWGVSLVVTNYRVAFLSFAVVASLATFCSLFMDYEYSKCDWDTQWSELRRIVLSPHFGSVFFIAFFTGVCNGCIWGFLLWHFQNLGASQTLIGVLEALQSISELALGYFCRSFLRSIGHIAALTLGLGVYAFRFVCYAAITNPLWLIPVEIIHGVSFLLTWTTLVSYLGASVPPECMTTVQGILGALYFGLGVGVGSLASGLLIDHFNAVTTFYGFAVASSIVMLLFMLSQQFFPRACDIVDDVSIDVEIGKPRADRRDDVDKDEETSTTTTSDELLYSESDDQSSVSTPLAPLPVKLYSQQVPTYRTLPSVGLVSSARSPHAMRPLSCSILEGDFQRGLSVRDASVAGTQYDEQVASPLIQKPNPATALLLQNGRLLSQDPSTNDLRVNYGIIPYSRARTYTMD